MTPEAHIVCLIKLQKLAKASTNRVLFHLCHVCSVGVLCQPATMGLLCTPKGGRL